MDPVGGLPSDEVQRVAEENRALNARLLALEGAQNRNPTTRGVAFGVDTRAIGKPDQFTGAAGWRDWSIVLRSYA
eukprot:1013957-Amphidinium_carterae.1